MLKSSKKIFIILLLIISTFWPGKISFADDLLARLKGRILLQVESHGEAWYLNPDNLTRYYLGKPADAFNLMRQLGLGISNQNFTAFNKNPYQRLAGKILIKTEDLGKAYYVSPINLELFYLGRPTDAFNLMRQLGLGISNADLSKIPVNFLPTSSLFSQMEINIHNLINKERTSRGLTALKWNDALAGVAREHSLDQTRQNQNLIDNAKICSYPFIHHEGMDFGLYHSDRLNNRGIYYFGASAENIALIPQIKEAEYQSSANLPTIDCQAQINQLNDAYEARVKASTTDAQKLDYLKQELINRQQLTEQAQTITLTNIVYNNSTEVENQTDTGWMNSPGHRQNILNPDYNEAGIGIAQIKNYFIITQVFIKRADCGFKTGACCIKPGFYPYCYVPLSCSANKCQ